MWLWWVAETSPTLFWLHLVAATLGAWRIAELVALDTIGAPLRRLVPAVASCLRCVSVWGGFAAVILWGLAPWVNWGLALAWLYLAREEWQVRRRAVSWPKKIVVSVHQDGTFTVQSVSMAPESVAAVLEESAATLRGIVQPQDGHVTATAKEN